MKRPQIASAFGSVMILLIGAIGYYQFVFRGHDREQQAEKKLEEKDLVQLNAVKKAAAEIVVVDATRRQLRSLRNVPGHVTYNALRHVEVKSPFDGLIRRIDVKVGEHVSAGQLMAVVDSPELGEKRADVLLRQTNLQRAKVEYELWQSINENLEELLGRLKRPHDFTQLEKDFAEKPLGDYRQLVLSAFAQKRLDESLFDDVNKSDSGSGAFGRKTRDERLAARVSSTSKFVSACDQATIDIRRHRLQATADLKDAENRLAVAMQRLEVVIGQPEEALPEDTNNTSLSMWPVKAPFAGTIEEILIPSKERIQTGQGIFQLADTSQLWIEADIRERDWSSLTIAPSQIVQVQTPALRSESLQAKVLFVGRTVKSDTHSVPLTAEIDNGKGLLRPGMFVRVQIPDAESRECLTVPQSSIVTNDGRVFVFVETAENEYTPADVKIGVSVDPWVEIVSGLKSGQQVVSEGAAILKAELLLQPEE